MILSIVVAISENNAIGKDNKLLWHLPADLKHFKEITSGHTIVMGRKTYDSIGKPLPNRRNIVVSRNADLNLDGVETYLGLEQALAACRNEAEVFLIGGAEIYRQALKYTNKIYLTRIHETYEADTFFPELEPEIWTETQVEHHQPEAKNPVAYTFSILQRK
ncbi:dihydrofolate reductase [Pedobacter sp. CAN_A7]|uniref:dihydrofolate reductase n=1 Tax=Pedobacter sp. CAN_A7 TaxID=2787722 RepID=UPI0018C9DB19